MGAVHGVYLKYVALSAISLTGYSMLMGGEGIAEEMGMLFATRRIIEEGADSPSVMKIASALGLGYSAVLNGLIAILFKLERGMSLIGKDPKTGRIPRWSYIIFFPFHYPSMLYTYIHTRKGKVKQKTPDGQIKKMTVPVASEVQPGWWVGGCYACELDKDWAGIVDLTVEFPEECIDRSDSYHLIATWDGVPATPRQLEEAAAYAVQARAKGDVLVHCAHGRGRSTTVMCACLVKAGLFDTWQEAFEKGIKPNRSVCKLNGLMRTALTDWQAEYVDGKKQK